ncbi:Mobile element protein [uncultured Candidatus Thioglobus sp.]|nr:Mobile element protein [uncultured Candidatus Thioglobus sp.]
MQIIQAFKQSRKTYGSPRVYHQLKAKGLKISLNKVARLMHNNGIHAHFSIRHKQAKISRNTANFANNILDREFGAAAPNIKWVSDITFVWTRQGWLYLATVIDLYSRKVAGWSMSANNNTALVIAALTMAHTTSQNNNKYYCILIKDQPTELMSIWHYSRPITSPKV